MRPRISSRRLLVEQLETREVPAGNVTAQLLGDTLVIMGDQFDNDVQLRQDDAGVHFGDQVYQGVNNVVIDLANGDDFVDIHNLRLTGNLSIDTGEGLDRVAAYFLNVGGDALIRTGTNGVGTQGTGVFPGDGEVVLLYVQTVDGTLAIDTGTGDDRVHIAGPAVGIDPMIGNLVIDTGEGKDLVQLEFLEVAGSVWLHGGHGESDELIAFFSSQSQTITGFEQTIP